MWALAQPPPATHAAPTAPDAIPINPSFLIVSNDSRFLYTVHGDDSRVSAFTVGTDGRLALLNTVDVGRRNPVHLALDPTGRWLIVAFLAVPGAVASRETPRTH
jgi:6-phosphogluconolactonase